MPMKVVYTTINGVIVHEDRNGVQRNYRSDTLGNTVALPDGTDATQFLFVVTLWHSKDGEIGLARLHGHCSPC